MTRDSSGRFMQEEPRRHVCYTIAPDVIEQIEKLAKENMMNNSRVAEGLMREGLWHIEQRRAKKSEQMFVLCREKA